VIAKIKAALGRLAGSLLGVAIITAFVLLPVVAVLWIASALGVPWALDVQVWMVIWLAAVFRAADELLPAWAWFAMITLLWLAFLDVHVRYLVRDELSKHRKALNDKEVS
jgi:hypothetical protein